MLFKFIIASFLISKLSAETQLHSNIIFIDEGKKDENGLVFAANGNVLKFNKENILLKIKIYETFKNKYPPIITIDDEKNITNIKPNNLDYLNRILVSNYRVFKLTNNTPSVIKNLNDAHDLFMSARVNSREDSQCYDRAHVWVYEWNKEKNIDSLKSWLFFSPKYIRKFKFDWWFHVAPMLYTQEDEKVYERIFDIKYSKKPLSINSWTNLFIKNNFRCKIIEKYSDYADYPESSMCYVLKSSMYYYLPIDLENKEISGLLRSTWDETEVRHAFLKAFDHYL